MEPADGLVPGVVREWYADEGWGVLDSDVTPGGCWAHASGLRGPFRSPLPGEPVRFTFEPGPQDGYDHRALVVVPDGVDPADDRRVVGGPDGVYGSGLTLTFDEPPRWPTQT